MVVKVALLQLEGVIVSSCDTITIQLSSDPGFNFRTLRSCYYFMIAHLLEYLPTINFQRPLVFRQ